jgi:hypothetical protein
MGPPSRAPPPQCPLIRGGPSGASPSSLPSRRSRNRRGRRAGYRADSTADYVSGCIERTASNCARRTDSTSRDCTRRADSTSRHLADPTNQRGTGGARTLRECGARCHDGQRGGD